MVPDLFARRSAVTPVFQRPFVFEDREAKTFDPDDCFEARGTFPVQTAFGDCRGWLEVEHRHHIADS
jgi:hypothetical protein